MRANTLLLFTCLCLHVACSDASSSSSQTGPATPTPPTGTGSVVANLDGAWVISDVERIDGSRLPLPPQIGSAAVFLPVDIGQEIIFAGDHAADSMGLPIHFRPLSAAQNSTTSINAADDNAWVFVITVGPGFTPGTCRQTHISAAFGTIDEHTLEGTVNVYRIHNQSAINPAQVPCVAADPGGTYRIVLERVRDWGMVAAHQDGTAGGASHRS